MKVPTFMVLNTDAKETYKRAKAECHKTTLQSKRVSRATNLNGEGQDLCAHRGGDSGLQEQRDLEE